MKCKLLFAAVGKINHPPEITSFQLILILIPDSIFNLKNSISEVIHLKKIFEIHYILTVE